MYLHYRVCSMCAEYREAKHDTREELIKIQEKIRAKYAKQKEKEAA